MSEAIRRWACGLVAALAVAWGTNGAASPCADLALVVSLDASASITDPEFEAHVGALAGAVLHPSVLGAFREAGIVDLAAVFWGGADAAGRVVDWQPVYLPDEAAEFALALRGSARGPGGKTALGSGLMSALDLIAERCAVRRSVLLVAAGRESPRDASDGSAVPVEVARARARREAVVVHALALDAMDPNLRSYLGATASAGPGALVRAASTPDAVGPVLTGLLVDAVTARRPQPETYQAPPYASDTFSPLLSLVGSRWSDCGDPGPAGFGRARGGPCRLRAAARRRGRAREAGCPERHAASRVSLAGA